MIHFAQQIKTHIVLTIVVLSIILISIVFLIMRFRTPSKEPAKITQPPQTNELTYVSIGEVVNTSTQSDEGIDTNSSIVKESIHEIDNVSALLPYTKKVQLSDGRTIEIVIPSMSVADNKWSLLVQLFGIDYEVPAESPEYDSEKQAFLEGVAHVKQFFEENNIDSSNIIIIWGDRAFIQQRAEEWLK